jgi:hypothetical protein
MRIKLLAVETTLTSATNVGLATFVRVVNTGAAASVTRKDSAGTTLGTITLIANEVVYLEKDPSDTLEGGASFKAVKIAY